MKNKKKEKRFEVDIDLKFTEVCFAKDRQKAMEQVVASFLDEYNLDITDNEVVEIREIKE